MQWPEEEEEEEDKENGLFKNSSQWLLD